MGFGQGFNRTKIGFKRGFQTLVESEATGLVAYDPNSTPTGEQIAWYRETATNDGAGNINPWTDKWTGNDQANATQANRPNIVASDPVFNNLQSYQWNGTSDITVAPVGAEGNFVAMNNGTGFLVWAVFTATSASTSQYMLGTSNASTEVGFRMLYNGTQERMTFNISNGTTDIVSVALPDGIIPLNTQIRLVFWVKDGLAPGDEIQCIVNDVTRLAGTVTGTFSSSNPVRRLIIGRLPSSAVSFFTGKYAEIDIITNVTVAESVALYLKNRYSP